MNEIESATFEDFLLQAGSDLFKRYSNDREKEKRRKLIQNHIKTASQFLKNSKVDSEEHTLALATLCHAYKALGLYDWNWETVINLAALRQSLECFTILSGASNISESSAAYIAEQRLWLCDRYKRALSKQNDTSADVLSVKELDHIIDQDFVKVVAAKSLIAKSDDVTDVLFHALYERRVGTKTKMDTTPLADWWRDDVDDRSIFLLRKIRIGKDFYSTEIWQWQFEEMLRSIVEQFGNENYRLIIDRISLSQCIFSDHIKPKFKRPEMDEKVFWLRCWRTQYHKSYRVYAAALARKRDFVETIIVAPIPDEEKRKALSQLRPLTVFSAGAMKTYKDYMKLTTDAEIYQHIIPECMHKWV